MKYTFQEDSPRSRKMCANLSQFVFLPNLCRTKYDIPTFWQILQNFIIFELFSLIFAQISMKFCRNFADNLENVEINFSEILKFLRKIPEF